MSTPMSLAIWLGFSPSAGCPINTVSSAPAVNAALGWQTKVLAVSEIKPQSQPKAVSQDGWNGQHAAKRAPVRCSRALAGGAPPIQACPAEHHIDVGLVAGWAGFHAI